MNKLKMQVTTTRTGYEVEDVDKMCEYMYYIMKDEIMARDKEIEQLKKQVTPARKL